MILLHLGALHPIEKVLTLVLAFGPFLVLAAVIVLRRRQDREAAEPDAEQDVGQDVGQDVEADVEAEQPQPDR